MQAARIAELLAPFLGGEPLTTGDLDHISTYIDILLRWNARINLTAIRDPDEIVTRHFGESFFAARHLFPRQTNPGESSHRKFAEPDAKAGESSIDKAAEQRKKPRLADIGSGAGFPGIPIKLWAPDIAMTLIESNHKKSTFLREIARALTLTDIDIQNARAESLPPASFDVVTLRAVDRFEQILAAAAALVAPAGRLALLISSPQLRTARSLLPTHTLSTPYPIPNSTSRILLIASR
ncbi:MAG: 16S rRNA (guanine(527)-N(7))-methyltransferase RsmG [Candidatus Sulfotelmatobacter sp.]